MFLVYVFIDTYPEVWSNCNCQQKLNQWSISFCIFWFMALLEVEAELVAGPAGTAFSRSCLWAFGDLTSRLTPNCKVWTHLISALASLCGMAVCWLDTDACLILFDLALASHSTQSIDYNRSCSKYLYSVSSTFSLRVWVFTLNVASHRMLG